MLIEVKVKVARIIDNKPRKRTECYLVDRELFSEAEYAVLTALMQEQNEGLVESYEIQSLRISPIKEVATQFNGQFSYIGTLKDIWLDDDNPDRESCHIQSQSLQCYYCKELIEINGDATSDIAVEQSYFK